MSNAHVKGHNKFSNTNTHFHLLKLLHLNLDGAHFDEEGVEAA